MTSTPTATAPAIAPPRDATPGGTMDDRYRSLFVIGRGGMGRVEVALERGPHGFERVVALKRLLPDAARDGRHKEMFLREARLAALLCHPNVVHAFAYGDIRGELFIAMEYVEGQPLSNVVSAAASLGGAGGGRLAPEIVGFVLAEACEGLHAAHELRDVGGRPLRVVHRDISPHNVMVAYDGRIKILDFGVAKLEASSHDTRTGEIKGKMPYMSPEQALGEPLDRRSDLYGIGAVLFECLTGRRMWGNGTDLEVMRKMALESPPRLDTALPGAPAALVELHARLVARDPNQRPSTAREVAEALRAFAAATRREDVRSRMQSLFGPAAAQSKALLTRALVEAAPSAVEELRQSLSPTAAEGGHTQTEAVIVRAQPKRNGMAWAFGGAGAAGLGGMFVAATLLAGSAKGRATSEALPIASATNASASLLVDPQTSSPSASTTTSLPAPADSPSAAPAQPVVRSARGASSASGARGAPGVPGVPEEGDRKAGRAVVLLPPAPRHAAPASSVTKPPATAVRLPDVDPAPF